MRASKLKQLFLNVFHVFTAARRFRLSFLKRDYSLKIPQNVPGSLQRLA
jgi:hypothetical protein